MTRITNFGRKRTYVEAGFPKTILVAPTHQENPLADGPASEDDGKGGAATAPPKKKRKRTRKKSKIDGHEPKADARTSTGAKEQEEPENGIESGSGGNNEDAKHGGDLVTRELSSAVSKKKSKTKRREGEKRTRPKSTREIQSELRRHKRIAERQADTTCFACREKGHAAKDCPAMQGASVLGDSPSDSRHSEKNLVGICYRCGSKRHSLSRCKKPADASNPLPFASCFVCSRKGHLASSCPQNKAKGIYPNGGCCKLCGDTTHLAKNCGLRKEEGANTSSAVMLGMGRETGADEDDFHTFKRRRAEVDKDERNEEKMKRLIDVKEGAHSGIIKSFGKPSAPSAKKVVYF